MLKWILWLIWHKCQRAYEIMNCPSCVILVVGTVVAISICGVFLATVLSIESLNFAHVLLVHAHEILGKFDLYSLNGSHFICYPIIASPTHVVNRSVRFSHRCARLSTQK